MRRASAASAARRQITNDPWFRGNAADASICCRRAVGVLAAIDSRTNKIVWKKELPPERLGTSGPLTTAGGLMFRGDAERQLPGVRREDRATAVAVPDRCRAVRAARR